MLEQQIGSGNARRNIFDLLKQGARSNETLEQFENGWESLLKFLFERTTGNFLDETWDPDIAGHYLMCIQGADVRIRRKSR